MSTPLWKIEAPALPDPHVRRPHLVHAASGKKAALLVAPAGYGKTALLLEMWQTAPGRRAWYTLDATDRDPRQLLAGLAAAVGVEDVMEMQGERLTIALDGIHHLAGAEGALRQLGELLSRTSSGVRFLMAGRAPVAIPGWCRLAAQRQVAEFCTADLALSTAEMAQLTGAELQNLAEGWPAAALIAARGDWFDYIKSEVIAQIPGERRTLLVALSVLDEWSQEACAAVLPQSDTSWLPESPLPLIASRPHPLFREYLCGELQRDPARHRALQRRAALWESERGRYEEALGHALAAEDQGLVEPLLRRCAARLLRDGQLARLDTCLAATPAAMLEAMPELLLDAGEAFRRAGRPRQAVRWLQLAIFGCASAEQTGTLIRTLCRLALSHADLGQWAEARAALHQAESELPSAVDGSTRAEILLALGEHEAAMGQAEVAVEHMREAAELFARCGEHEQVGAALVGLGARALVAAGKADAALDALRRAQERLVGAASCDALLSELQILMIASRREEAEGLLLRAAPASPSQQAQLHWLQSWMAIHRGDLMEAERLWRVGDQCLVDVDRTPALLCAGLLARLRLDLSAGSGGALELEVRQVRQLAEAAGAPLLKLAAEALLPGSLTGSSDGARRLQVELLGSFRVRFGEQEIKGDAWGRARARALFQFLLLRPGYAAGREALLEAFWPEEAPGRSRNLLRVTLHQVRKTLETVGLQLETGPETVRLPVGAVELVDLHSFRTHLSAARRVFGHSPERCIEHCRLGRTLYRGDLLPEAPWLWAEEERGRARRELLELLHLWQEAARQLERFEEAIVVLEDLLVLEPGMEQAERELIILLARTGRRSEALSRYRRLVRWLRQEVGLDPSPETRAALKAWL